MRPEGQQILKETAQTSGHSFEMQQAIYNLRKARQDALYGKRVVLNTIGETTWPSEEHFTQDKLYTRCCELAPDFKGSRGRVQSQVQITTSTSVGAPRGAQGEPSSDEDSVAEGALDLVLMNYGLEELEPVEPANPTAQPEQCPGLGTNAETVAAPKPVKHKAGKAKPRFAGLDTSPDTPQQKEAPAKPIAKAGNANFLAKVRQSSLRKYIKPGMNPALLASPKAAPPTAAPAVPTAAAPVPAAADVEVAPSPLDPDVAAALEAELDADAFEPPVVPQQEPQDPPNPPARKRKTVQEVLQELKEQERRQDAERSMKRKQATSQPATPTPKSFGPGSFRNQGSTSASSAAGAAPAANPPAAPTAAAPTAPTANPPAAPTAAAPTANPPAAPAAAQRTRQGCQVATLRMMQSRQ